jgi:hypothetical protein
VTDYDDRLLEANWDRMREALKGAATEYQRVGEELLAINFDSRLGVRRSADAIISQAALTGDPGRICSDLMHRLAACAGGINEISRHAAASQRCGYQIDDPVTVCVLNPGHDLPEDDGLTVHVSASGVMFA